MKRWLTIVTAALFASALLAPTALAGSTGSSDLNASFQAGLSGGSAIDVHSEIANALASPQTNPEGRIEPFGAPEYVCDELVVGTWVFVVDPSRALLDQWTNEFKLDGVPLDTVRTPLKRVAQGPAAASWWFAEGVPVLGVLEPGLHVVEFTFDDGAGFSATITTDVFVDSAFC